MTVIFSWGESWSFLFAWLTGFGFINFCGMVILERPFVSGSMLNFLRESGTSVLKNKFSECFDGLNFVENDLAADAVKAGEKLYTVSENALSWIYENMKDSELAKQVSMMKNKAEFRRICASLYPDFFFKEVALSELKGLDVECLPFPFVLKPSVGFLSAGVYVVENKADWFSAIDDVFSSFREVEGSFPDEVIDGGRFILEEYVGGEEYAVDAYFDDCGKPVIVNIFHHPFLSGKDVADRLYLTSKALFDKYRERFCSFLSDVNGLMGLKNVPVHIEFRVDGDRIMPIEINPMRFAGMCLNELFTHLYGKHPVEIFLNGENVDYEKMWKGNESSFFCFVVLEKDDKNRAFSLDLKKISDSIKNVLDIRLVDNPNLNIFGFLFVKIENADTEEVDRLLRLDVNSLLDA